MASGRRNIPPEGEERIAAILELVRSCSILDIHAKVLERERALRLGPYLHPTVWTKEAYSIESSDLDVLRRLEDLRRAIIEADDLKEFLAQQRKYPSNPQGDTKDEQPRSSE